MIWSSLDAIAISCRRVYTDQCNSFSLGEVYGDDVARPEWAISHQAIGRSPCGGVSCMAGKTKSSDFDLSWPDEETILFLQDTADETSRGDSR